jgi:hypothetical protein
MAAKAGDGTDDGYGLGFGLRSMISDKVELEGMINWTKGEAMIRTTTPTMAISIPTETTPTRRMSVGGRYHWLQNVSTGPYAGPQQWRSGGFV